MNDLLQMAGEPDLTDEERILADGALADSQDDAHLTFMLCEMLARSHIGAAYVIAKRQIAHGVAHPGVYLAQALGGLLYGNAAAVVDGQVALLAAANLMSATQQASFYTLLVQPLIPSVLERSFCVGDNAATLRLLDIVTAASPSLRSVFDLAASVRPLDLDAMRRSGAERARLITMSPPPPRPRRPHRAVVAFRDRMFPQFPWSRQLDVGPHIQASVQAYGWTSTFRGMDCQDARDDCRSIADMCERVDADILFLDEQMPASDAPYGRPARAEMIDRLRQSLPGLKIIGVYLDAWQIEAAALRQAAADVDVVWAPSPAQPACQQAAVTSKWLSAPLPYDIPDDRPPGKLLPRLLFSGGVKGYNWHRAFWLTAAAAVQLPVDTQLSSHATDGLPALESSAQFMRKLADATCALNFSMRPDLSRIITGRSFETCLAGSLLVQEATPDMDYYFVAGEHYLEFTTFTELCAIAAFLSERPDEAEDIRRRGAAFAGERYGDKSIMGSLDHHLEMQGVG